MDDGRFRRKQGFEQPRELSQLNNRELEQLIFDTEEMLFNMSMPYGISSVKGDEKYLEFVRNASQAYETLWMRQQNSIDKYNKYLALRLANATLRRPPPDEPQVYFIPDHIHRTYFSMMSFYYPEHVGFIDDQMQWLERVQSRLPWVKRLEIKFIKWVKNKKNRQVADEY